jgi:F420-non-reducing hydrogenase iron-sulfur subunit
LRLDWVSASEGQRFARIDTEFTEQTKKLGPSPLSEENLDKKILENIRAAKNAASNFRLRVLVGRERELTEKMNVYGEKIPQEEFDSLLDEIVKAEFIRHKIRILTRQKPLSVKELAAVIDMKTALVLRHIVNMRRKGMIALDRVEGTTPLYKALEVQ